MSCKLPHALPRPISSARDCIVSLSAESICLWLSVRQKISLMSLSRHRANVNIALDMTEPYSPSSLKLSQVHQPDGPGH